LVGGARERRKRAHSIRAGEQGSGRHCLGPAPRQAQKRARTPACCVAAHPGRAHRVVRTDEVGTAPPLLPCPAPRPRVRRFHPSGHPAAARRCSVRVGRVIGTRHYCLAGRLPTAIDHPSSEIPRPCPHSPTTANRCRCSKLHAGRRPAFAGSLSIGVR
jgi:hypothetical protein